MRAEEVLALLAWFGDERVVVWVDGGWGVDALLGRETRHHQDLDLVVDAAACWRIRDLLINVGFKVVRDWLPTAIAFKHPDGREVDLHPVELTADGGGDQIQLDGTTRWHYGPPVGGRIRGQKVSCCSVETQIASHLGYEPGANDRADVQALSEEFDIRLPPPYAPSSEDT